MKRKRRDRTRLQRSELIRKRTLELPPLSPFVRRVGSTGAVNEDDLVLRIRGHRAMLATKDSCVNTVLPSDRYTPPQASPSDRKLNPPPGPFPIRIAQP